MKLIKTIISCLLFFLFVGGASHISAQGTSEEGLNPTPSPEINQTILKKIEYTLPYPGMLPDHPLYNLKRVRDYILERLIADPVKKSEFYILQADKRLQMGVYLAARGKNELAETTISKGEKYMEKAQGIMTGLHANNTLPPYVVEKYENALGKHYEVLAQLATASAEPLKSGLSDSIKLVTQLLGEVPLLKK